jgi:long-chain acyl-CoA synthetase
MLLDALLAAAREKPSAPAVSDPTLSLSYKQLARLSAVFRGVIAGDTSCERVGIMLPATAAFPAVLMGTWWAGKIAIPLNFLLRAEELVKVIADAQIDYIITVKPFAELVESLSCRVQYLEDLPLKRKMIFAMFRGLPRAPKVESHQTAVILYTSGTTAQPKGVELTFGNLHSNCVDCIHSILNTDQPQRFLNILPPFHVFGLTANVLIPIFMRAWVFAIPRFSPIAAARAFEEHRITVILAIPSMYAAMLRVKSAKREAFEDIYIAISGGEPLPESVRTGFQERFRVTLGQGYGLTETSPVIAATRNDERQPGIVGRPIRNAEVRIVDEQMRTLPLCTDGEIIVRGPGLMKGYYRKPEETAKVIDKEGWFHTGDIGRFDEHGFLAITGRLKEMLIIGGENVFPREIEAVLEQHEDVLQSAVIGIPDGLRGEAPIAFVLPKKDTTIKEDELRNFARQRLAGFKTPKRVIVREDLPTGPTGKILKRKLREFYDSLEPRAKDAS